MKMCKKKMCVNQSNLYLSQSPSADIPRADAVHDTVGAVCVDHFGNVAAAASSGGIWLKHAGRLGAVSCVYFNFLHLHMCIVKDTRRGGVELFRIMFTFVVHSIV